MAAPSAPPASTVFVDCVVDSGDWPDEARLAELARRAIETAAAHEKTICGSVTVVLADDDAVQALNWEWRGKDKPTNVLSFPPGPLPPGLTGAERPLGDIVLARETLEREAAAEGKPLEHHFAHLVVHGFLHLAGHDHETDAEAEEMEALERRILADLAIADPYA